jgi:hypothetical protein
MKVKKIQKQISIKEYIEIFCQEKRVRERYAVYVSEKTHHNLRRIAGLFASKHHTTTSSLADSILSCHFEAYKDFLKDFEKEYMSKLFGWLESKKGNVSETPEESPEEQPDDIETDERASNNNDEPAE